MNKTIRGLKEPKIKREEKPKEEVKKKDTIKTKKEFKIIVERYPSPISIC